MKIIPVIHHLTNELTLENAKMCAEENAYGVFLISMTHENEDLPMLAKTIKGRYPQLKVGINLLGEYALNAVEISREFGLDMTWGDNPIVTSEGITEQAKAISDLIKGTDHMFFNSVAFKYQKKDNNPGLAATLSYNLGFIPTTSGKGTGHAADLNKIIEMKTALVNGSLGIASGLDPDNIKDYLPYIEYGLVATGISTDFNTLNREKTRLIIERAK